ncbi:MAG: membrane protein insertion efficiency factor YidD [Bacteroidetes bacterium]|nr:membrane protein insertion efficiency factor YidD [Bacteroidota bacterium]
MKSVVLVFLRVYQIIVSPLLPLNTCRFYPSCSSYAVDAVKKYGAWSGMWRALKRVGRCHPFHPGGYDPA